MKIIKKNISILSLTAVFFLLVFTNYTPGTWLTGWDNLHPEFDFWLNIKRSLFTAWQEYQGLGLLGGMGHASDLLHQVFLWPLSFILPLHTLRYFYHFLLLFIGAIGAYFLIRSLDHKPYAFFGSLFYLLNLATIQTFYAPFEAFSTHYAFLPWLLLATTLFFHFQTRKNVIFLLITLLLSSPAAYIPTLFIVFLISTLPHLHKLKTGAKFYLLIFLTNAFWLLPFLYFTLTNASVNVEAKINQMATDTIYLQNKEFGNIQDVMLLKGFWLNNVDPNSDGNFAYMMEPWRTHIDNPLIAAIGYLFFIVIVIGIIQALKTKKPVLLGFTALFLFSFTMLATNTPPFSWIDILFRKIPLFDQAFRFPFTKFSILASLTYSIFFAVGIEAIIRRIKFTKIIMVITITLLIGYTLPAFYGHLFYEKERLTIPKEYFELFDFFKKQDPNTRIANFPQTTFWGWSYYRWGYGGSGFLWYGIKQPILDRAFDVWSKEDENYYFEVSHALYSKNPKLFEQVLNKYQITWIVLDKNIINPSSLKALFFSELEGIIKQIPTIEKIATFDKINVYKIALKDKSKSFVSLLDNAPLVNTYTTSESDQAFIDYGNYISNRSPNAIQPESFYPFRSLFANKLQKDLEFSLQEAYNNLIFTSALPERKKEMILAIPSLLEEELIPADIVVRKLDKQTLLILKIETPEVSINTQPIWGASVEKPLFAILPATRYPLQLDVNGLATYSIQNEDAYIQRTFISSKADNVFVIRDQTGLAIQTQTIPVSSLASLDELQRTSLSLNPSQQPQLLTVKMPKISDGYIGTTIKPYAFPKARNCDNFRPGAFSSVLKNGSLEFFAKNATACTSLELQTLPHKQGYALFIPSQNTKGRPLHFWLLNDAQEFSPIDTYLSKEKTLNTLILAPQDDFGKGYSVHFDNVSIGTDESLNTIGEVSFYPIPYRFITALVLHTSASLAKSSAIPLTTKHPNESLYIVDLDPKTTSKQPVLLLSQSFNHGWKAYYVTSNNFFTNAFPFFFGTELKDHVLVNNWANGWVIEDDQSSMVNGQLVILFLPQYLEYFGFFLLVGTFGWFLVSSIKFRLPQQRFKGQSL